MGELSVADAERVDSDGADRLLAALARFEGKLDGRGRAAGATFSRAVILASASRHRLAGETFARLLEQDSAPFPELSRLATVRCARLCGDHERALSAANGLDDHMPETVSVDLEVAHALISLGRLDSARERLEQALRRHATRPARIALVLCLSRVTKDLDLPELGVAACDEAIRDPALPRPALWATRGGLLVMMGRWDDARADLDRALAVEPALAGAQANRGLLHLIAGEAEPARARFQAAVLLDPSLTETCEEWWYYDGREQALWL